MVFDPETRETDYDDDSITENTRACYPIELIDNAQIPCMGAHPKDIIFLTCDAFGVLPPVSRLTPAQAMYHFLSGYTAKTAGTEVGVNEPEATFSACFGAAFLVLHPARYAELLAKRMKQHHARAWLVNTGWTGGPYGVGSRMKLTYTRAVIDAIHDGFLADVPLHEDPIFELADPGIVPRHPHRAARPAEHLGRPRRLRPHRESWPVSSTRTSPSTPTGLPRKSARRGRECREPITDRGG